MIQRIVDFTAVGNDNRTHVQINMPLFVFIVNGVGGTDFFTFSAFSFGYFKTVLRINGVFQGDGLSIFHIDGLPFGQTRIIFIGYFPGTFFGAGPTGDAFVHIHIAGTLQDTHLKIARFAFKRGNL